MSYYECKRCNFRSKQKTGMIRHLTRKNKCIKNIQSYKYSDDELYNLSLKLMKEDELDNASLNKCTLCDKNFSTKGNLKKHIKKHEDGTIPYNQNLLDDSIINEDNNDDNNDNNNDNNNENDNDNENDNNDTDNNENDIKNNIKNHNKNKNNIKNNIKNNHNNYNINTETLIQDKNGTQTINNITVNQQFNNYNIINMKYPISFDKEWDLSQISYEQKLFLISCCTTKYSELLKFILQNDDNLNVIIENETNTGLVYLNDTEKYIHLNKSEIITQSLTKLNTQLNNLCQEVLLKNNNPLFDKNLEYESLSINKKFQDYKSNHNNIKSGVENIISDIFNEKKDKTISIMNEIIERETNNNLLENNGF